MSACLNPKAEAHKPKAPSRPVLADGVYLDDAWAQRIANQMLQALSHDQTKMIPVKAPRGERLVFVTDR